MASQGPLYAGTVANDSSNGTGTAWTNPSNATATDDSYATVSPTNPDSVLYFCGSTGTQWGKVRIVKGDTIHTVDVSDSACLPTSDTFKTFGGAGNLWGHSWTYSDINASNFGVAFTFSDSKFGNEMTNYLKATNFGFSIPSGATIDGIVAEIEAKASAVANGGTSVDSVRLTVYYTTGGGGGSSSNALMVGHVA